MLPRSARLWRTIAARGLGAAHSAAYTPLFVHFAELSLQPLPRLVDAEVLPAHNHQTPRALIWLRSAHYYTPEAQRAAISHDNPARLLFLQRSSLRTLPPAVPLAAFAAAESAVCTELPWEHAALHQPQLPEGCRALAPWGIDAATDALHARKVPANSVFLLFADSLAALHWGLHDWAHFHSHGPFERVAETEVQCDVSALCWSYENRTTFGLDERAWLRTATQVLALWPQRFAAEQRAPSWQKALRYLRARTGQQTLCAPEH